MNKFITALSIIMIVGMIIGLFVYQNQVSHPLLHNPNHVKENEESPNELEQAQPEDLWPVNNEKISYSLQNNELHITYNNGVDWVKVPIEKDLLFEGEYNGNQQELITDSYILTENRTAFLYTEGAKIAIKYSLDQGNTWQDSIVTESFPSMRFRKVDFLNDQFGYVILSGDRTMSQEYSTAFLTHDGGMTWQVTSDTGTTRLIAFGGFTDESTGFLSYGTINPEEPDLYVTQDGGNTWSISTVHIPEKYDRIFVQAEVPVKEGDHLSVLINQGPNGDYLGGKVKGQFISNDNGLTWDFSTEVKPIETE